MKWSILQKITSKFTPKKFYEIDPWSILREKDVPANIRRGWTVTNAPAYFRRHDTRHKGFEPNDTEDNNKLFNTRHNHNQHIYQ